MNLRNSIVYTPTLPEEDGDYVFVANGSSASVIRTKFLAVLEPRKDRWFKGKTLAFEDSCETAELRGQSVLIERYDGRTGEFVVTPLTTPPVEGDIAKIKCLTRPRLWWHFWERT